MLDPRPAYLVPDRVRRLHPNRRSPWLANDLCIDRTRAARRMRPAMNTPQRPDPSIVSSAIPMVYVGRNHDGLWVALDADTRIGGLFLFKSGALRFGHRRRNGRLSATMEMPELELPGRNRGNPLAGYLAAARHAAARVIATVAAPLARPLGVIRAALAQAACARASACIHRAAIERELYHDQYRISTKCDDDLRIAP